MSPEIVFTPRAPAPAGPYSQAVRAGNTLYVSGQIALDKDSGRLVEGDVRDHTRTIMASIQSILEAGGASLDDLVKTTVFITDLEDYARVNEAYAEFFPEAGPARSCVQVSGLPRGAPIEIEAVAHVAPRDPGFRSDGAET